MAKIRIIQSSFVSGELDPKLFGRIDTEIYPKAAAKLRNVYVRPQGGVSRREGLEHIDTLPDSTYRMIPFEFNNEQNYILIFHLTSGGSMLVITADDGVVQVTISDAILSSLTATTVKEMTWTQSADTLILFHNDFKPIKVLRTSDTVWTFEEIDFENIPPFAYGTVTSSEPVATLTADVTTGIVTLTASASVFDAADVGQFINTKKGGRVFIKTFVSGTELEGSVIIELEEDATSGLPTGDWDLEAGFEPLMSDARGFAATGVFHKSRLWLGFVGERPQTLLASKIGNFFDLDIGSGLDDEGIDVTIDDNKVNRITDFFSGRGLQVFTTGGEFVIGSDPNATITPRGIADQLEKQTIHGSGNDEPGVIKQVTRPVSVDGTTIFVEIGGTVVRQFVFNDAEQSFNAANISILSSQLVVGPVAMDIRRATDVYPSDFLYMVNSDGTCAVLNSLREQDLLAWSLFETTGNFTDTAVAGRQVYFIVERNVNGVDTSFVERLNNDHFMDSSVRQTVGSPTDTFTGFDHLDGEEIRFRGDDFILDDETPSGGSVTVSEEVILLEGGFNFIAKVLTLPLEVALNDQTNLGQFKAPRWMNIRLFQSRNVIVNYAGRRYVIPFRTFGEDVLDDPVEVTDEWKKVYLGGFDREVQLEITQEDPLEFNVLALVFGLRI